jgi:hypothetical protein
MDPFRRLENEKRITFPNGTTWTIDEKVSEKEQRGRYPSEWVVLYKCTKVVPDDDMKAIIKAKKQYYYRDPLYNRWLTTRLEYLRTVGAQVFRRKFQTTSLRMNGMPLSS